jgi:outer membrane protein TolC
MKLPLLRALCVWGAVLSPAAAQTSRAPIELAALHQAAFDADPRLRAIPLQSTQSGLRQRNIEAERLPTFTAEGQAQLQSDVPTAPAFLPTGQPLFAVPKDTYDAHLRVDQRIVDPTIAPRLAAEKAQLAEADARVRSAVFGLRQEVNDAFFAAALLQERAAALAATIADLESRLNEAGIRVREGASLASEAAAIEATLLQRRQDEAELRATRRAALARLSRLTGRALPDSETLAVPDLGAAVARARPRIDDTRARPEYESFARTRDRIARQREVAAAQDQLRISAYGRVGVGRPGLNFISDEVEPYGLAGIQFQWRLWNGGTTTREREALAIQQQIVAADEAAFTRGVSRATENDLAAIDRLTAALDLDERIVTLREQIERTTQVRFSERVVTAAEYLDRSTELLDARSARAAHRVELAQAAARLLTTLGLEVR